MTDDVTRIGAVKSINDRRIVSFYGERAYFQTALGYVIGFADGAVVLARTEETPKGPVLLRGGQHEFTPRQARDLAERLTRAALAVETWAERASGFSVLRIYWPAYPEGYPFSVYRGRTRPMRVLRCRPSRRNRGRYCGACRKPGHQVVWVCSDDLREHGYRVRGPEVCPDCVERLRKVPAPAQPTAVHP